MKTILYFAIVGFFLLGCRNEESKDVELIVLKPQRVISKIDSLFFVRVSLNSKNDDVFVLSQNPSLLVKTNSKFEPLWVHDKEGEGPSDLSYPEQSIIIEDKIYVLDHGNQSIKVFETSNGSFVQSFRIPERVSNHRFNISKEGNFYFSVLGLQDGNSVIEVNSAGNLIKHLGVNFPETGIGSNRQMKYFQLDNDDNIIFIGASLPYVEIINNKGGSIKRFSLEDFEPIKRALDSLENDIKTNKRGMATNSIPSFIVDAQYVNGKLYISFTDRIGLDRSKARNLLEFKINEEVCELTKMIKFQTDTQDDGFHPRNFYVDSENSKLLVQGLITGQIYEFELPE